MESTEQILPHMSAAKQDRIRIWRHEVATAHLEPDQDASTTTVSSATSTTTSSSSSSRSAALVLARGRHILSKLAHKLSLRPSSSSSGGFWRGGGGGGRGHEEGTSRTAMYATLSPDYNPDVVPVDEDVDEELIGAFEGENPRDAVLREKQERLMRAAKLLDKGRVGAAN
ncbi:hypothetical protein PWT90_11028 [Aphanocladium album]|nr:hypothetical protein PWT90_11028 [Aphanocladium album]